VPDAETVEAAGGAAPFTTKHLLTAACPLPQSLLTYVRLDRLTDHDVATFTKRAQKEGLSLWDLARREQPLDSIHELCSLGALRGVLAQKLAAYPTSLAHDWRALAELSKAPGSSNADAADAAAAERTRERRRFALTLRANEKKNLHASLRAIDARIVPQLAALLGDAATQDRTCRGTGQVWSTMMARRQSVLPRAAARVSLTFERLAACTLGDEETTAALHLQSCTAIFMLLAGLGGHPLARETAFLSAASPFEAAEPAPAESAPPPTSGALGPLPPLNPKMLRAGEAGSELKYASRSSYASRLGEVGSCRCALFLSAGTSRCSYRRRACGRLTCSRSGASCARSPSPTPTR
jgi:hypothetical protein